MLFKKQDIIVFAGDSVTDCGRLRPAGEASFPSNPYGNGYVALFAAYVHVKYPQLKLRIINQGRDGARSSDLLRDYAEVTSIKPDWMFLMIGINDVWRQFDSPNIKEIHVDCINYKRNVEEVIKKNNEANIKTVLLSPFIIEKNENDPFRMTLAGYQEAVKNLSSFYHAHFIDIQSAFDNLLEHCTAYELSRDRIHPSLSAHMKIMLTVAGYIESDFSEK